jgi:hypothetical protein
MTTPLSNRPKITQADIDNGFVIRYFVRNLSTRAITEVDNAQYIAFQSNPLYQTLQLSWIITGRAYDTVAVDGKLIYGAEHKNLVTITFYDTKMPGLIRLLNNPLLYFNGVYNKTD